MRKSMHITRIVFVMPALLWLAVGTAEAQFIGLNIAPNHLAPGTAGPDTVSIDLVDDLDLDNPEQSSMALILEHPITALPNIKYRGYSLNAKDISTLSANISFNGENLGKNDATTPTFDLSHDDLVLYYRLPDKRLNLDLGVDLKHFDGEVLLNDETDTSVDVDETIPLLYLSARYELPNSGFYVGADINASFIDLGLSDSSARDSTIMLGYDSGTGLGVEGGFKHFSLELNDVNNLDTDLEQDGIYLNGYINF